MANKKEMKQEAISRMQQLKIDSDVIELFSENDKLMCSENGKFVEVPEEYLYSLEHGKRNTIIWYIMLSMQTIQVLRRMSVYQYLTIKRTGIMKMQG